MDETFFRSPPHGLGNSPSTAGPNSSYFAKIFLRRVPCDFSEQTLVQVLCTFELLLDSATFWFLSRLLESLHVTRPTSVNRVARKRQHKSYLVATSTWSSRCVYVRTVYTVAKFHRDPLFSSNCEIDLWSLLRLLSQGCIEVRRHHLHVWQIQQKVRVYPALIKD